MAASKDTTSPTGAMNAFIEVQQATTASDGLGGFSESWSKTADIWMDLQPVSAGARLFSGVPITEVTHTATCKLFDYNWFTPSITRLIYAGRTFNVTYAYNMGEQNRLTKLELREVI